MKCQPEEGDQSKLPETGTIANAKAIEKIKPLIKAYGATEGG